VSVKRVANGRVSQRDPVAAVSCTKLTNYGFLYGYLGLIIGFGVTALSLILFTRRRLVTNTTDQKTRVSSHG
jgi:hypothetical protein